MTSSEQTHRRNVLRITRVMGSVFALADVLLLGALGFGYVLPRLLAFSELSALQFASAVAILLLLGLVQVLLLPIIAVLFGVVSYPKAIENGDESNEDDGTSRHV